jgi:hypothetical protein
MREREGDLINPFFKQGPEGFPQRHPLWEPFDGSSVVTACCRLAARVTP